MEGQYLAETRFDYTGLLEQPGELSLGPRLYVTSVLPTLIAAIMLTAGSAQTTILCYRLLMIAFAAGTLMLLYYLLETRTSSRIAVLICLAVVTTPAFSTQIEMCGMEMPYSFFILATAHQFAQQRYGGAVAASVGAYLIKAIGVVSSAALAVCLGLSLYQAIRSASPLRERLRLLGFSVAATAIVGIELAVYSLGLSGLGRP